MRGEDGSNDNKSKFTTGIETEWTNGKDHDVGAHIMSSYALMLHVLGHVLVFSSANT